MAITTQVIPFARRVLIETGKETPVVAKEILNVATANAPEIKTARMIAKKGVRSWGEIGNSDPLPIAERVDATKQVVDRFINAEWLKELETKLKSNLGGKNKVEIVFTRAYEDGSLNLIPPAMAAKIQAHLRNALPGIEVKINETIFQASKANRTAASNAASLIARQQIFEGLTSKEAAYLLVDEHIEAGGTLRGLDSYIRSQGGHVAALSTLTRNPGSEHLRILPQTLEAINHALGSSVPPSLGSATAQLQRSSTTSQQALLDNTLAELGLSRETLTNSEGLAIVAHLSDDKNQFDKLLRAAGTNLEEFRQGYDYLANLLDLPKEEKTLDKLVNAIHLDLGTNYQYMGKNNMARG